MSPEESQFRKEFYQSVVDQELQPDDRRYYPIYSDPAFASADPVGILTDTIELAPGRKGVQLLSGFRGSGKSTELRRLRKSLQNRGYTVALINMKDHLNLSTSIDVSDFLMVVAGAFGDALVEDGVLDQDPAHESYWFRALRFLTSVRFSDLEVETKLSPELIGTKLGEVSTKFKVDIKNDPTFRERLQKHAAGHLGALVEDVHGYIRDCVARIRTRHGKNRQVVLLVDSVEHIRGTSTNEREVQESVERLFVAHCEKLHLPELHVVYTVHPYLKVKFPALESLYDPGGVRVLPAIKLREPDGSPVVAGRNTLHGLVDARGNWRRVLGDDAVLDRLIDMSGGYLRDLLRLLQEITVRTRRFPASPAVIDAAIAHIRSGYLPVANQDAFWLDTIARTHQASLDQVENLPALARFLDSHLVLCYLNGSEWFDLHPLIVNVIRQQVDALRTS